MVSFRRMQVSRVARLHKTCLKDCRIALICWFWKLKTKTCVIGKRYSKALISVNGIKLGYCLHDMGATDLPICQFEVLPWKRLLAVIWCDFVQRIFSLSCDAHVQQLLCQTVRLSKRSAKDLRITEEVDLTVVFGHLLTLKR